MTQNDWRELERLVALIEHHLAPKGAVVRSPDHLIDKRTGQSREVDASIRYVVGSVPILITVECRERSHNEDVTWIEQLVTKREALGAACTVAVSSTGFSKAALETAVLHGIETRLLRELNDDTVQLWADGLAVLITEGRYSLATFRITMRPTPLAAIPTLSQKLQALIATDGMEAKLFRRPSDGADVSIADLLRSGEPKAEDLLLTQGLTMTVPAKSELLLSFGSNLSELFEDLKPNTEPVTRSLLWSKIG